MTPPAPAPDGPTVDGRPYADVLGGWGVVPHGLVVVLGAAAVVVVAAGLRSVAWLIGPGFLALIIVVSVAATSSDGSDHEER